MGNDIGYSWLAEKFNVKSPHFRSSKIGGRMKTEIKQGSVLNYFIPAYDPGDQVLDHVAFAFKYEGLHLDLLRHVFNNTDQKEIVEYINAKPSGMYARQIGFFYEFLTGKSLEVSRIGGNYINAADDEMYVLPALSMPNAKWKINNNLPGSNKFCPLVRKTSVVKNFLNTDFGKLIDEEINKTSPAVFKRAINYFYFKETKSSNEIERDTSSPKREELFVRLLSGAGSIKLSERLSEQALVICQNAIAEPRFRDQAFRTGQNYVGENSYSGHPPKIHLIGMPPEFVHETMEGIADFASKTEGMNAGIRAACLSFGFVFIHPFEDGNGRIHRFLINDTLANDGVLKKGMILPVSAVMLKKAHEYDEALEQFSKPLMQAADYIMDENESITVKNGMELSGFYQYPDMTAQAEYLLSVIEETVLHELPLELNIIRSFDAFRLGIRDIIDMPDKDMNMIIKIVHQGGGRMPKAKRGLFFKLSDAEITSIEQAYETAFKSDGANQKTDSEMLKDIRDDTTDNERIAPQQPNPYDN